MTLLELAAIEITLTAQHAKIKPELNQLRARHGRKSPARAGPVHMWRARQDLNL
jgi:hypothetical protein